MDLQQTGMRHVQHARVALSRCPCDITLTRHARVTSRPHRTHSCLTCHSESRQKVPHIVSGDDRLCQAPDASDDYRRHLHKDSLQSADPPYSSSCSSSLILFVLLLLMLQHHSAVHSQNRSHAASVTERLIEATLWPQHGHEMQMGNK